MAPNAIHHFDSTFCVSSTQVHPCTVSVTHTSHFSFVRPVQSVCLSARSIRLSSRHIHLAPRAIHVVCTPSHASNVHARFEILPSMMTCPPQASTMATTHDTRPPISVQRQVSSPLPGCTQSTLMVPTTTTQRPRQQQRRSWPTPSPPATVQQQVSNFFYTCDVLTMMATHPSPPASTTLRTSRRRSRTCHPL